MVEPLKVLQISDAHLFADPEQVLLGVKTSQSLKAIVDLVHQQKQPDLILLTGDLSQDETAASYHHLEDILAPLKVPMYWIPGNHDNPKVMAEVFPRGNIINLKQIVFEQWQIILLNSHRDQSVAGYLVEDEFIFMEKCLADYPKKNTVIVLHHHPIAVGSTWLDKIGLQNNNELWQKIQRYPAVKIILFGHVHQQHEGEKNGVQYFSTPSTCIQFKRNSADFALEKIPQGFRELKLFDDGTFTTEIIRLPKYIPITPQDANFNKSSCGELEIIFK